MELWAEPRNGCSRRRPTTQRTRLRRHQRIASQTPTLGQPVQCCHALSRTACSAGRCSRSYDCLCDEHLLQRYGNPARRDADPGSIHLGTSLKVIPQHCEPAWIESLHFLIRTLLRGHYGPWSCLCPSCVSVPCTRRADRCNARCLRTRSSSRPRSPRQADLPRAFRMSSRSTCLSHVFKIDLFPFGKLDRSL